ncbi:MAG: phosphoribosylglycinamide formyltransferase [Candidatus Caenarcaniphilales bacterium]|nr:phosphoribosylglycinamide formyltransferase [Candidatus Caenarcaniphilales bacterium]
MADRKKKIGILASGAGSNIPSILKAIEAGTLNAEITLLISNKEGSPAISLAKQHGFANLILKPDLFESSEAYDARIASEFWNREVELIALCGYTRIISLPLLKTYAERIINIHPSLLPSFGGKGMYGQKTHEAVIQRGVKISGCTVHLVDEGIDEGQILSQSAVRLFNDETPESLREKVFQAEQVLYPETIALYLKELAPPNFNELPFAIRNMADAGAGATPTPQADYFDDQRKEYHVVKGSHEAYALCDTGLKRKENADTVLLSSDLKLLGVADGVGSAKEGKQTSRMLMSFLLRKWQNEGLLTPPKGMDHGAWIRKAVIEANQQILNWARKSINKVDIGSTLVVGMLDWEQNDLYISNTGDSRAYLWRSQTLYRLTRDHSANYNVETGEGGDLVFYMGGEQGAFGLDLYQLHLYPGDKILMCSDGVLYASEDKVAERFAQNLPIKDLGLQLVQDVFEVGAPDNTSIVLLYY